MKSKLPWRDSRYASQYEHLSPIGSLNNLISHKTKDMPHRILNKVEESDKILKGMKPGFSSLNQIVSSYSRAIKSLKQKMSKLTM